MRRVATFIVVALLVQPQAVAAPKTIQAGLGSIYSAPAGSELVLQSGRNLIYIANTAATSADISLTAFDLTGAQVWQRTIDSSADEVTTAATIDSQGNLWLAGSAALTTAVETTTPIIGIDNPDNVINESATALRKDMNQLALWKVNSLGELTATYLSPQSSIPVATSISATNSGVSIVGSLNSKPFFISATTSGSFGKLIAIGSAKSEFNTVVRHPDGTSSIYGSSSETIAGKKTSGIRDGVLIRLSKTGAITKLVRSYAQKSSRSWTSGDSSYLTSGPVISGNKTEIAITKFSSLFAPLWTFRVPGTGASTTLSANGYSYLALTSRTPITGIANWKPTTPSLIVITFDGKGLIKAATALPGLVTPLSLQYSKERGVTGLASASDGTVSIFTLVSR